MSSYKQIGLYFMRDLSGCNYIRISIVQSEIPAQELLIRIKDHFESYFNIETEWGEDPQEQILFIFFPSFEEFKNKYEREIPYFSTILQVLSDHPEFDTQQILTPLERSVEEEEGRIYCTLQYETNNKTILRNYYKYIFRLGQMLGMQHEMEEIENGFLLFYKRALDFELSMKDYFQFDEVIAFLKENNLFTPQTQDLVAQMFTILKPNSQSLPSTPKSTGKRTPRKR
jgi:hypothetical protein